MQDKPFVCTYCNNYTYTIRHNYYVHLNSNTYYIVVDTDVTFAPHAIIPIYGN